MAASASSSCSLIDATCTVEGDEVEAPRVARCAGSTLRSAEKIDSVRRELALPVGEHFLDRHTLHIVLERTACRE